MNRSWLADVPPEEAVEGIEAGILGHDAEAVWAVLEQIAAVEPELFAELIEALRERHDAHAAQTRAEEEKS